MDILEQLLKQVNTKETLNTLGASLDATPDQVKTASAALLPALLGSMSNNAQTETGLNSLFSALGDHQNTDLSNVNNFLGSINFDDASKMVGHILGNNSNTVQKQVAKESGMSAADVGKLTTMLAPLIMGFLGNQKKQSGFDAGTLINMLGGGDLTSVLTGLLGGATKKSTTTTKTAAGKASTNTNKKVTKVESTTKSSNDLVENVTDLLGSLLNKK